MQMIEYVSIIMASVHSHQQLEGLRTRGDGTEALKLIKQLYLRSPRSVK